MIAVVRRVRLRLARRRMIRLTMRQYRWSHRRAEVYVDAIMSAAKAVLTERRDF